ncbi:MAG: diphthine synthase [Euryarchaeota archaeon TMED192]|nr:MAG: diphthine synthase [Euryarchaeota archaeon TMED192]
MKAGLRLIGIGPGDLGLMTVDAVEAAAGSDHRFLEGYTATLPIEQEELLESRIGPWNRLMRPDIEMPEELLRLARSSVVALLVVGDPMQATTHVDLLLRARDAGLDTEIIPGISATTLAITLSGLQSYRFGRQVTLPFPYGDYLPVSPLRYILDNKSRNLHTLVLLDLDPTGLGVTSPVHMSPAEAGGVLLKMVEKYSVEDDSEMGAVKGVSDWPVIVLSDLGTRESRVCSTNIRGISNVKGGRIHCLILPSSMDDLEQSGFDGMFVGD